VARTGWTRRRAILWAARASILGGLLLLIAALPTGSSIATVLSVGTEMVACAVFLIRLLRMPGRPPVVWASLWLSVLLLTLGDTVSAAQSFLVGSPAFPGPADLLFLASYVPQIVAVAVLVRRRNPRRDLGEFLDAAIIAVPVFALTAVYVITPLAFGQQEFDGSAMVAVTYPVLDLVVLAGLLRIAVGGGHGNRSLFLLTTSVGVALLADLVYQGLQAASSMDQDDPSWLLALYTGAILLMTAAALSSEAPFVDRPAPVPRRQMSAVRAAALCCAALSLPVLILLGAGTGLVEDDKTFAVATMVIIVLILTRAWVIMIRVVEQQQELDQLARTDELTSLPNRRSWDHELARTEEWLRHNKDALTCAMFDLDLFKDYNDALGHAAGDQLLREAAQAWRAAADVDCYLARYGGEEFAMLLPGRNLAAAEELLERLRLATPEGITVSIGCAQHEPGQSLESTLAHADAALYAAKSRGRNMVLGIAYQRPGPMTIDVDGISLPVQ